MIGWRGASRYYSREFRPAFELECAAIKKVRNQMKLTNLKAMVPFCRTVKEAEQVIKIIAANGLKQGDNPLLTKEGAGGGFELYCMVEIPSNVILLEDFIKIGIDGISVGTNDLTMLILGADRDNPKLANVYNEENPAVLWALEKTIKTCQKMGITSSICGQAPSTKPKLIKKLVKWGITSISVNPDAIDKAREFIAEAEKEVIKKK